MSNRLTYYDFAYDEYEYLLQAYRLGLRYNAMVSQAQRICECLMKHLLTVRMFNVGDIMMSHNLRDIYNFIEKTGIDISPIRNSVMTLNNFYTHTRYPGRDAFLAREEDVDVSVQAIITCMSLLAPMFGDN